MSAFLLSPHFTLAEATKSDTAKALKLDNTPDNATFEVILKTAAHMEVVRKLLGKRIKINSWYRSPEVNLAVGSKPSSQHTKGEAVDWVCPTAGTPAEVCKILVANKDLIKFDQLILEHTWIHISFAILSGKPRGQVLSLLKSGNYATGLTTSTGTPIN
jgi:hypothetical protein